MKELIFQVSLIHGLKEAKRANDNLLTKENTECGLTDIHNVAM